MLDVRGSVVALMPEEQPENATFPRVLRGVGNTLNRENMSDLSAVLSE